MSKHTPGPWIAKVHRENLQQVETDDAIVVHWTGFSTSDMSPKTCKANAHLIAAAPDMLAALEAITKHAQEMHDMWCECGNPPNTKLHGMAVCLNNRAGDLIEAAIKKAKGEE